MIIRRMNGPTHLATPAITGGDMNPELLRVRDTVSQVTGMPARPFRQWASENADAFR
ncbi:hypothetical protein [Streptomyces sp. NBC_01185]|uniref:hypothetical protein n=1 Tax=Streptomyces sp. NBC_01185 TaxID=2903764 RepID=UPI0038648803|nr:hypothetical protein OG770_37500 [Streptomyces sp. NBC_01185]